MNQREKTTSDDSSKTELRIRNGTKCDDLLEQIEACKREVRSWPEWMRQTGIAPAWMTEYTTDL